MLKVEGIDVSYGLLKAVKGVSIRVNEGETIGIFGPNGHGKTTILKTICGLLRPQSGKIIFCGKNITKLPPYEIVDLGITYVPEGCRLFPDMTVLENLKLGAYLKRAWKDVDRHLNEVFELFPTLKERKNQKCYTLSGGERQMVAVGRGLMSSPKLLMLDEPSLGLSPKVAINLMEKIKEIRERGISIILVEQNVRYAMKIADRLYLIEKGEIAREGKRENIIEDDYVKQTYLGLT
jgi:branched-chain amino acid transport system ATP-binding protein